MAEHARGKLAIFVKAPVMGRAKTRLAQGLGAVHAMHIYRALVRQTVRRLAREPRWRTALAVTPDHFATSKAFPELMPVDIPRIPQGPGDLGRRMARVFARLAPGPAVIVGSDIPDLRADDVARAFRVLRDADAVLGSADDGGYWLIGFTRTKLARALENPIRWSSAHALADTRQALGPVRIELLRTLMDIDTVEDYERCRRGSRTAS
jgi:rSAM/selenodomain-associated transferase 1